MKEKVIELTPDFFNVTDDVTINHIRERFKAGPKGTKITMVDPDTGKELGSFENKIVLTGSIFGAVNAFGINTPVIMPDYNRELNLDNTLDYSTTVPKNIPIVCLFCIGDSGCGSTQKDVYPVKYIDRIDPIDDIIPFRYVDADDDLNKDLRKYYFGRKEDEETGKISYFFKNFDTNPQLHIRYTDGTQINDEAYEIDTTQAAECFVQTRLRVTRNDFRDYFEQVLGWDKARISTLSLCYAWYDNEIDEYLWYQQIYPYSKLNFPVEWLQDLTKAVDFVYSVYY